MTGRSCDRHCSEDRTALGRFGSPYLARETGQQQEGELLACTQLREEAILVMGSTDPDAAEFRPVRGPTDPAEEIRVFTRLIAQQVQVIGRGGSGAGSTTSACLH